MGWVCLSITDWPGGQKVCFLFLGTQLNCISQPPLHLYGVAWLSSHQRMHGQIDVSSWGQGSWEQLCLAQLALPLPHNLGGDADSSIPKMEEVWIPESGLGGELPRELANQNTLHWISCERKTQLNVKPKATLRILLLRYLGLLITVATVNHLD